MENKPFFAKYIAVEGEIKEGDKFIWLNEVFTATPLTMKMGQADRPVKLFLCSRDIQVGDKYFLLGDEPYEFTRTEETTDFSLIYAYKVIGEISPEATWVTEGMTFSEEEIGYGSYKKSSASGEWMVTEHGQEEWLDTDLDLSVSGWKKCILIKCPTCGRFH